MGKDPHPNIQRCIVQSLGAAGAAFMTTAACVDNLVAFLFGPGMFWLIIAPLLAGAWGLEYFCAGEGEGSDENDR